MSIFEFLTIGAQINRVNQNLSPQSPSAIRRFKANFGTSAEICAFTWEKLEDLHLNCHGSRPLYLLCALLFLKTYGIEETNAALTGLSEKTFREWSRYYVWAITQLNEVGYIINLK